MCLKKSKHWKWKPVSDMQNIYKGFIVFADT